MEFFVVPTLGAGDGSGGGSAGGGSDGGISSWYSPYGVTGFALSL